ncbi:MAG TPA: hypothetical protein VN193_02850 [Candidatus Angelobacter sp.]|nr:hypothetical protein [Candidatus Angelobacter sp.]
MARQRSLTDDDGRGRRRRLTGMAVVALLVTLGGGIAVGRWTVAANGSDRTPATGAGISAPLSASAPPRQRVVAGVPEGFPDTADGARAAALAFLHVEVSDLEADPEAYRAAWREMCTPTYYAAAGRAAAETVLTNQESINHLISNAAHRQRIAERVEPLTVSVTADDGQVATVRTWSLLIAHPGDGPTVVSFDAGTVLLRWYGGDWKLDGGTGSSARADGASGPMRLDDGPDLPPYLAQPEVGR